MIGKKEITVNNLIPVFASDEDRNRIKETVENGLYDIFSKYIKS